MLERVRFKESEVISYLEEKILNRDADNDEMEMYEDYKWNGFINKINYKDTYRKILFEMKGIYEGGV